MPGLGRIALQAKEFADVRVTLDGRAAVREDRLRAAPSRSAWIHASLALAGSALGLAASAFYVQRAHAEADAWAMKMAVHMAAWHLILALTLFPASVWGQRPGIRAVQAASAVFFAIHAGIGIANAAGRAGEGPWIALLNAASGLAFLCAALQGQRAHADMDPWGPGRRIAVRRPGVEMSTSSPASASSAPAP